MLDSLAYAGSGNVLKVQELLALCGEHPADEDEAPAAAPAAAAAAPAAGGAAAAGAAGAAAGGAAAGGSGAAAAGGGSGGGAAAAGGSGSGEWRGAHQWPAVIGLALIAMGEPLGAKMAQRALEHLLQYGEPAVRRAVPLAIAVLSPSDPDASLLDALSRLSHDADQKVAQAAVVALGIVGAGTNNARLAGILRNLSSYYYKEPTLLYLVRDWGAETDCVCMCVLWLRAAAQRVPCK